MKETIGQRVLAAVLSCQLGISTERAMKLYVRNRKIHSSWESVGELLLGIVNSSASRSALPDFALSVPRKDGGPKA
jgi:hypothetical protein